MKLVEGWRNSWRWFSIQMFVVYTALIEAWQYVPADIKSGLPQWLTTAAGFALLALGILSRLIKQPDPDTKET